MSELLPAMEQALQDFSGGKVVQPARGVMAIEPAGGHLFWMPARSEALGVKIVTDVDKSSFQKIADPYLDKLANGLGPHADKIKNLIRSIN